jgi:hypothetical protein
MNKAIALKLTTLLLLLATVALFAQNKPKDSFGRVDKADVSITQIKPNRFAIELNWDNDQKLAAMAIPLTVRGNGFRMHYDSVTWSTRTDYFAVKSVRPLDSLQQVLVGLFATLDSAKPPLVEGKGKLATLYFTSDAKSAIDVCNVLVDTTFIAPSNSLYGVTPEAENVQPAFVVNKATPDGKPVTCK